MINWICAECGQLFDEDEKHIVSDNRDLCGSCYGPMPGDDLTLTFDPNLRLDTE